MPKCKQMSHQTTKPTVRLVRPAKTQISLPRSLISLRWSHVPSTASRLSKEAYILGGCTCWSGFCWSHRTYCRLCHALAQISHRFSKSLNTWCGSEATMNLVYKVNILNLIKTRAQLFKTDDVVSCIVKILIIEYGIYANIFFSKNTRELDIILTRKVNIVTTIELVMLMMLWTTGPRKHTKVPKTYLLTKPCAFIIVMIGCKEWLWLL